MKANVNRLTVAVFFLLAGPIDRDWAGVVQNFNSPLTLKVYVHYSSEVPDTVLGFTPVVRGHRIHINPGTFWYVRPEGALNAAKLTRLASDIRHYGIPGLDLSDHWEISDESLRHLRSLPSLRLLDLSRTKLTDECSPSLATLTNLSILILPEAFHDRGLGFLGKLHHLRDLSLDRTKIGDEGLKKVASLPLLESLDLSETEVTNRGLEVLRNLAHLKRLVLGGRISDAGTSTLAKLISLQHIDISQTQISDGGLSSLAVLPHLESIYLNRSIGDRGIKRLSDSHSLKSLDLSGSAMTDLGLLSIAKIKSLEELDISQTAITDAGVIALADLPNLHMLELSDTKVTHLGVSALSKVPHLDILSLSWQTLSRQDLQSMSQLHQIKTMILNGVPLPSSTMAQLRKLNHASPWDHVSGVERAELAQSPPINDQVLSASVAGHTQRASSLASLTQQPLSAPIARGDATLPVEPGGQIVEKKSFWSNHVKTIFVKSPTPSSTASTDALQAPQSPEKVAELKSTNAASSTDLAMLKSASIKSGVSATGPGGNHSGEDLSAAESHPDVAGPTGKNAEDNLLKAIVLQSDPSKHGGFSGLSGMKQFRLAQGNEGLNALVVSHDSNIDTQPDKPENSLGEIEVGARH